MQCYDVIVIGSGAGNIIVEEALKKKKRVALIEKGKFGGTCLTRGCIPTKVLATCADKILEAKKLSNIGISVGEVAFDWEKISSRVWSKIEENKQIQKFFQKEEHLDVYEGRGFFLSNKVLQVEYQDGSLSEELTGKQIFLGTGARTKIPKIQGLEESGYITSETFFGSRYPKKPYESIAIIGGGAIATEFAHIFSSFGTKVHIVIRSERILRKEEKEISEILEERFMQRGIVLHRNCDMEEVSKDDKKKKFRIFHRDEKREEVLEVEEILVASGLESNVDGLAIDRTDVVLDDKGWIQTNEFLETTVDGIYAFGDANGVAQFRHTANYEADILSYNQFISQSVSDYRVASYRLVPSVTFTTPQVAHVGLGEEQALELGYDIEVGRNYYRNTAKGFALGYNSQDPEYVKVIVDKKTDQILGVHGIGSEAALLIQPFLNMMSAGEERQEMIREEIASSITRERRKNPEQRDKNPGRMRTIRETMVPHPTLSEVGIWTFYDLESYQ